MPQRHPIEFALDLARLPALARTSVESPIPPDIIDLIRIAAATPNACADAAAATGEPAEVLVEAARFYLRQLLFKPEANSYRVLGLQPGATRATAREHMRCLLEWLHPDRNSDLDAVYARRVVEAWREISASNISAESSHSHVVSTTPNDRMTSFRLPWIEYPASHRNAAIRRGWRGTAIWAIPTGLLFAVLAFWSAMSYFGPEELAAFLRLQ